MANERIDELYTLARRSGAIGGKLVGAGVAASCSSTCGGPMTRDRQWQPLRLLELPFDFEFSGRSPASTHEPDAAGSRHHRLRAHGRKRAAALPPEDT